MEYLYKSVREICKITLVAFYWLFPIFLARENGNNVFLWLFAVSFFATITTFSHYEIMDAQEGSRELKRMKEEHKVTVEDLYPKKED